MKDVGNGLVKKKGRGGSVFACPYTKSTTSSSGSPYLVGKHTLGLDQVIESRTISLMSEEVDKKKETLG
jgi:hypothetical protein